MQVDRCPLNVINKTIKDNLQIQNAEQKSK